MLTASPRRDVTYWNRVCQAKARPYTKSANIAGAADDTSFEQAFSNLAHAYLRERAPELLEYEQGFQLIDRDEDDTRAVGVFGFRVRGSQMLAPVFFMRGKLKGHELLYLKDQDMIVPLKEDWINQLLNKKTELIGTSVDQGESRRKLLAPDLNSLRQPYRKYASSVFPFVPVYAAYSLPGSIEKALDNFTKVAADLNLADFLKRASLRTLQTVVKHCERHPEMLHWLDHYHGPDVLSQAIKMAKDRECGLLATRLVPAATGSILKEAAPTNKVRIIAVDYTEASLPEGLNQDEQTQLLNDGVLIQDSRSDEETSKAYKLQVEKRLQNPEQTGLFEVLVKPGDFKECLTITSPIGAAGRYRSTVVVAREAPHTVQTAPNTNVWTVSQASQADYQKWYDSLPDADTLDVDSTYVLLGPRGQGSLPFHVNSEMGDGRYSVHFVTGSEGLTAKYPEQSIRPEDPQEYGNVYQHGFWSDIVCLHGKRGSAFHATGQELTVPTGFKKLKVDHTYKAEPLFQLGSLVDAELGFMRKTAELKIVNDGLEVWINTQPPRTKTASLVSLVRDHGLREGVARELLKEAESRRSNGVRVHVKYAAGYSPEYSVPFPEQTYGSGVMTERHRETYPQVTEETVPGLEARNSDLTGYVGDTALDQLSQDQRYIARAAETGQREVFDLGAIGSILKSLREDSLIDRYMPNLFKGMDALGRILMSLYAHSDKFADRYGRTDMPELEDNLRNAFEQLGDVVLYLKQKDVQLLPDGDMQTLNLE